MEFKDYYQVMGLEKSATPEDIKRAFRKLARKYHPDVSKEKDAESRFKELAEAHIVLKDPEKRAAYDRLGATYQSGQDFQPPPEWAAQQNSNGHFSKNFRGDSDQDRSAFFDALFRNMEGGGSYGEQQSQQSIDMHGKDQHAKIQIKIEDSYIGATRTIDLKLHSGSSDGQPAAQKRTLEFIIPKGIRAGQHIRLAGQGGAGMGQGSPGDLYLDVEIMPHPLYRTDGHDVLMSLPIAPWEAALGAELIAPTPAGHVEIKIPAGSVNGRKLRLKGRGLPGKNPGNFYFVLQIVQPVIIDESDKKAFLDFHAAFQKFNPREAIEARQQTL